MSSNDTAALIVLLSGPDPLSLYFLNITKHHIKRRLRLQLNHKTIVNKIMKYENISVSYKTCQRVKFLPYLESVTLGGIVGYQCRANAALYSGAHST